MIQDGYNFFGQPLAAGDSTFSSTSFATKIHSVGISLEGYVGMNNYATGSPTASGPASSAPNSLSATPYVFLIPTGMDVMRTPPLGDTSITRSFDIQDYALPLPFNIGDIMKAIVFAKADAIVHLGAIPSSTELQSPFDDRDPHALAHHALGERRT